MTSIIGSMFSYFSYNKSEKESEYSEQKKIEIDPKILKEAKYFKIKEKKGEPNIFQLVPAKSKQEESVEKLFQLIKSPTYLLALEGKDVKGFYNVLDRLNQKIDNYKLCSANSLKDVCTLESYQYQLQKELDPQSKKSLINCRYEQLKEIKKLIVDFKENISLKTEKERNQAKFALEKLWGLGSKVQKNPFFKEIDWSQLRKESISIYKKICSKNQSQNKKKLTLSSTLKLSSKDKLKNYGIGFRKSAPPSLSNLGNTCYYNSMLQALSNLPGISDYAHAKKNKLKGRISLINATGIVYISESDRQVIQKGLFKLLTSVKEGKKISEEVLEDFHNLLFKAGIVPKIGEQSDSHMLVSHLFGILGKEGIFNFKGNSQYKVLSKEKYEKIYNNPCVLQSPEQVVNYPIISIKGEVKLTQEMIFSPEKRTDVIFLQEKKLWKGNVEKSYQLTKSPKILQMLFKTDSDFGGKTTVPTNLKLKVGKKLVEYTLCSRIKHSGTTEGGHYTADVWTEKGEHYYASDSYIAKREKKSSIVIDSNQVLFYVRVN